MLAVVAVRPSVEPAVAYRGHVVGHQIAADLVAFVDRDPQRAGLRLPVHSDRVAEARRKNAMRAARRIDLPDRGAPGFLVHAVLADIAVGPDPDVQPAAIAAGNQAL